MMQSGVERGEVSDDEVPLIGTADTPSAKHRHAGPLEERRDSVNGGSTTADETIQHFVCRVLQPAPVQPVSVQLVTVVYTRRVSDPVLPSSQQREHSSAMNNHQETSLQQSAGLHSRMETRSSRRPNKRGRQNADSGGQQQPVNEQAILPVDINAPDARQAGAAEAPGTSKRKQRKVATTGDEACAEAFSEVDKFCHEWKKASKKNKEPEQMDLLKKLHEKLNRLFSTRPEESYHDVGQGSNEGNPLHSLKHSMQAALAEREASDSVDPKLVEELVDTLYDRAFSKQVMKRGDEMMMGMINFVQACAVKNQLDEANAKISAEKEKAAESEKAFKDKFRQKEEAQHELEKKLHSVERKFHAAEKEIQDTKKNLHDAHGREETYKRDLEKQVEEVKDARAAAEKAEASTEERILQLTKEWEEKFEEEKKDDWRTHPLEGLKNTGDDERNFAMELISNWLAPKWLLASKAQGIEDALFRYFSEDDKVGERYRLRAKQLSMKMCPIALASLTHNSELLDSISPDMTEADVDHILDTYETELDEAGKLRAKLWNGEIDFATFVGT